jgi:lipoprotein-anchoring transpeptidase ErfK/SrfK
VIKPSGDGWFLLQASYGPWVSAASDQSGQYLVVSNDKSKAQRFRFESTTFQPYQGNYVEVNISTQRLLFVRNGYPVLECDVTTGKPGFDTPTGIFRVLSMSRNVNLVGSDYNVWSDYWMPFTTRGHGLHDAFRWRSTYGGKEYLANGSHGCVNMSLEAARTIYENSWVGFEVRIHY